MFLEEPYVGICVFDEKQPCELPTTAWAYPKCVDHMMIQREGGELIQLVTFSNCDTVELVVGDRKYGERQVDSNRRVIWNIAWEPSVVKAIARKDGEVVCEEIIKPFGETQNLRLLCDKEQLEIGANHMAFVEVRAVDKDGNWNQNEDCEITIENSKEIEIVGIDNGDICHHYGYKNTTIPLYKGKCLICVRGKQVGRGELIVSGKKLVVQTLNCYEKIYI